MLTITKKAATEAECNAILNASLQVEEPFSVPVIFIDPAEYAPQKFLGLSFFFNRKADALKARLAAFAEKCDRPDPDTMKDLEGRDFDTRSIVQISNSVLGTLRAHFAYRDNHLACSFPVLSPRFSVTLCTIAENAARAGVSDVLQTGAPLPDYPGFDSQYNFLWLWHETAHSVAGDNEAGAELTAALAARHAFEDCTFVNVWADMQVTNLILKYESPKALKDYGWSCVEALESALALETAPDSDTVRNVGENSWRVPRFDRSASILAVAECLHRTVGDSEWYKYRNLNRLADTTDHLIKENRFGTAEEKMIAARFALATRRLATGTPAYQATGMQPPIEANPVREFLREFI